VRRLEKAASVEPPNWANGRHHGFLLALLLGVTSFSALLLGIGPSSALAAGTCANEAIRLQQGATNLPECRAYEMVSPAQKKFASVYWKPTGTQLNSYSPEWGVTAASPEGETAVYPSWGIFAESENGLIPTYRSKRGADGWTTTPGAPALTVPDPNGSLCFCYPFWKSASSDLGTGMIVTSNAWSPLDTNSAPNRGELFNPGPVDAYLRLPDDQTELVSTASDGSAAGSLGFSGGEEYQLARDGNGVLFQTANQVVPQDATRAPGLVDVYLHHGGETTLLNLRPDGTKVNTCGSRLPLLPKSTNGEVVGSSVPEESAISADGSTAIFTAPNPGFSPPEGDSDCAIPPQLYERTSTGEIVDISASQRTIPDPTGPQEARFVKATPDDSRVLFTSSGLLTNDTPNDGSPPSEETLRKFLYEYSVSSGVLRYVTTLAMSKPGTKTEPEVKIAAKIYTVSEDLSHVFVISLNDLAAGATEGIENLYDVTADSTTWIGTAPERLGEAHTEQYGYSEAMTTKDGSSLVFVTWGQVAGFNQTSGNDEVYLYREGGPLRCLSCSENPAAAQTNARIAMGFSAASLEGPGRYADSLSEDGSVVAFETGDALLPGDRDNHRDVYLWKEGHLSLVTPEPTNDNAYLLGMSRTGRDIFIATTSSILKEDVDGGDEDIYDLRVGGGFPTTVQTTVEPCSGEACQAPAAGSPAAGASPGSESLKSPTNPFKVKPCKPAKTRKGAKGKRAKGVNCHSHRAAHKNHRAAHKNHGGAK
jgi:hypothetical protein